MLKCDSGDFLFLIFIGEITYMFLMFFAYFVQIVELNINLTNVYLFKNINGSLNAWRYWHIEM